MIKTIIYTALALLAFAGNSVLCRLALADRSIDPASFTLVRLLSGVVVLVVILSLSKNNTVTSSKGSWASALMLFVYALAFSFAYLSLDTGTGALILFAAVQITMIIAGLISGTKLHYVEWLGMLLAFSGFVYLVGPSVSSPSLSGFILMTLSGIAWAFYTLGGRGSSNPLADTSYNFLRTLPFLIILLALTLQQAQWSQQGIVLAILSGGLASGIGYAIWYAALRGLSVTLAAVVQLLVPVIAAVGGVLFANEVISRQLMLASTMILGGILMVVLGRYYFMRAGVLKG